MDRSSILRASTTTCQAGPNKGLPVLFYASEDGDIGLLFLGFSDRASSIRATCRNVFCQGAFSCYNVSDIRSKPNRMNQE